VVGSDAPCLDPVSTSPYAPYPLFIPLVHGSRMGWFFFFAFYTVGVFVWFGLFLEWTRPCRVCVYLESL
jgi:hypothetical protein